MRNFNKLRKMQSGGFFGISPLGNFLIPENPYRVGTLLPQSYSLYKYHTGLGGNITVPPPVGKASATETDNTTVEDTQSDQKGNWLSKEKSSAAFGLLQLGFSMANNYLNKDLINGLGFDTFNQVSDSVVSAVGAINPAYGAILGALQTGINGINAAGAKKSDAFSIDAKTQALMGGSYVGSYDDMAKASQMAGKKYGLFNRRGFKQALEDIAESKLILNTIQDINQDNQFALARANNVQMNSMNYANKLNGGIDFNSVRIGKTGLKLDLVSRAKSIKCRININTKKIEEATETTIFREGGVVEFEPKIHQYSYTEVLSDTVDFTPKIYQKGGKTDKKSRTIEELIEYAKQQNPRFILRMSEPVKYLDLGNGEKGTHMMGWATDDNGNAIVYSQIQENDKGNLFDYGDAALDRALKNKNYLIMTPEEAKLFTESGKDSEGNLFGYKKGWSEFFLLEFKQGGAIKESEELVKLEETNQKNIIPEGALHKNKHHMEHTEGLTQKGIPVIDNDGELLAEIELNEIIFTLEVTKKLEELHKIYKEGNKADLDKAAIEAGKLLVQEILYNTDDRTGLITKCEKGGKL